MSIPTATTSVAVFSPTSARLAAEPDEYAPAAFEGLEQRLSGVRAVIGQPFGAERGNQTALTVYLTCDPIELSHLDVVVDESTDQRYEVAWSQLMRGFGLDHTKAGLRQISGSQ